MDDVKLDRMSEQYPLLIGINASTSSSSITTSTATASIVTSSLKQSTADIRLINNRISVKCSSIGDDGPMWSSSVKVSEDDSSLDSFLPSNKDNITSPCGTTEERTLLPLPASPFSQLFPMRLLSESGLDMTYLQQPPHDDDDDEHRQPSDEQQQQLMNMDSSDFKVKQPNGAKTHFCLQCSAGFTRRYSLNKHVHEKHAIVQLKRCPLPGCSFVTRNVNSMLAHRRNHLQRPNSGAKPQYFCKLCSCRYTQRRSLLQHITIRHGSDASLVGIGSIPDIPESTNTTTTTTLVDIIPPAEATMVVEPVAATITKSRKTTTPPRSVVVESPPRCTIIRSPPVPRRQFACDRCAFTSTTFRVLFAHKQKHHKEPSTTVVSCMSCRRQFSSVDKLVAHMRASHQQHSTRASVTVLACDQCDFQTTTKRVFAAHKRMHNCAKRRQNTKCSSSIEHHRGAPMASVAPYPRAALDALIVPTIPHELEAVVSSLNQANSHLIQLVKRKDTEMNELRVNVGRLLLRLLPVNHYLHPALMRNLICGPQIDQTIVELLPTAPASSSSSY